jgi:hypothetical protein
LANYLEKLSEGSIFEFQYKSMPEIKQKKERNFGVAVYLSKTYGNNLPDEKIIEIAKAINKRPSLLLKNYKSVTTINGIFDSLQFFKEKSHAI